MHRSVVSLGQAPLILILQGCGASVTSFADEVKLLGCVAPCWVGGGVQRQFAATTCVCGTSALVRVKTRLRPPFFDKDEVHREARAYHRLGGPEQLQNGPNLESDDVERRP